MKTKIKLISIALILTIGMWILPQKASAKKVVSYQVFYDELSPYGTWADTPYGYVWKPAVARGFTPYATNGYWAYTDEGWTWVSNYPWGWAPFHYGRWYTDKKYGSVWIPGTEWGPGWVDWKRSGDYYAWAPLGPGIGKGVPYGNFYGPHNRWTYANGHDFGKHHNKGYHYYNPSYNFANFHKGKKIDNFKFDKKGNKKYNAGPQKHEIEKYTGKKITPYVIKESAMPGQKLSKNQLQLFKPQVYKNNNAGKNISPSKVVNMKNVKPSSQKKYSNPSQKTGLGTNQKQSQSKQTVQPNKQQQTQSKKSVQPAKQQPQQKQNVQPVQQKQSQPKQSNPSKKG